MTPHTLRLAHKLLLGTSAVTIAHLASAQWIGAGAGGADTNLTNTANWGNSTINGSFVSNTVNASLSLPGNQTISGAGLTFFSNTNSVRPSVVLLDGVAGAPTEVLTINGDVTLNKGVALNQAQTSATWSSGTSTIDVASTTNLAVGQVITGTGIPANTTISAISGNSLTISANTTAGGTNSTITATTAGTWTSGTNTVSVSNGADFQVGAIITGGTGLPGSTRITDITGNTLTLSANTTAAQTLPAGVVNTTSATFTSGTTSLTVNSVVGLAVGQSVSGSNISAGSVITSVSDTTITISIPTIGNSTNSALTVGNGAVLGSEMELALGGATRRFNSNSGNGTIAGAITLNGAVSGTGKITINGGTLNLTNPGNTFSGGLGSAGSGLITYSTPGALGQGNATLEVNNSSLTYTGNSAVSVPRNVAAINVANLNNSSSGGASSTLTITGNSTTSNTLTLGGANKAALNEFSGEISGAGGVVVGSGISNDFSGASWKVSNNANTYAGTTSVFGLLEFSSIGNVGAGPSSLGAPTSISAGTISGGSNGAWTLRYTGSGHSTDRQIRQIDAGTTNPGSIVANGTGPLVLTTGYIYNGTTQADKARSLTLDGLSTLANTIGNITFNFSRPSGGANGNAAVNKNGPGLWILNGTNSYNVLAGGQTSGTYTTTVNNGTLRVASASALPLASRLAISGGVLELGAGNFTRDTASTASDGNIQLSNGGFSAFGANRTVNLGGASATKTWGVNGFMSAGGATLQLSSTTSDATLDFQNGIDLGATGNNTRTIQVNDGTASIDAILSGVVGSTGGTQSLTKSGNGTLVLTSAATYTGNTTLAAGTLALVGTGSLGAGPVILTLGTTLDLSGLSSSDISLPNPISGSGTVTATGKNLTLSGTYAPRTIYVSGNLVFGSGAQTILVADASPADNSTTSVGGTVLNGGTLVIEPAPAFTFASGQSFTFATAGGGITSGYDGVTVNGVTLALTSPGGWSLTSGDLRYTYTETSATLAVAPALVLSPLQNWRQLKFGTTDNFGTAADAADPDADGRINLLEYATGTEPLAADSGSVVTLGRSVGDKLTLTFNRVADPALTYRVRGSGNLTADWNEAPAFTSTGGANVSGSVTVEDTVTAGSQPRRFLRLEVSY